MKSRGAGWRSVLSNVRGQLAETAVARDRSGGTAKAERDLLRRSGLLLLSVPCEYGGIGASWIDIFGAVRELAQVDPSLAHLFAFQHLQIGSILLYASREQQASLLRGTVEQGWFWGNALNPRDARTHLTADGTGFLLDGIKSFCSGARDSDRLLVSTHDARGGFHIAALPTVREGITVLDDWDNMGQRQTDSGTVSFERVAVAQHEVLGPPGPFGTRASLRACLAQTVLGMIYLGIAQGALEQAITFTREQSRPWPGSGVETALEDAYIQQHYGEFHVALAGAEALSERALAQLKAAWDEGDKLGAEGRGEAAVAIATFKVAAMKAGLDIATRLFEVTGARATHARHGFDRYWRNLRTHSLHDPVDYKLKDLGCFILTGRYPVPGFYS
ncbi:acyl-CoA dehydrogenase family protein [Bradyrhizobium sp. DASA03076]|uniref:Dibenzothiophene monooxygenase n=1 Tax=Bradyrhizobium manausense TaxID=989370 RepID=A0A0R3E3L1_9BRAD|nr:acyl-CoA dehydrogenase family protein [Bradyrhizobium manausense]KRQ16753.1 monooxygenase [Bradyrhizobium manausense]